MPLKSVSELFQAAYRGKYALGYFESWSIDSLQGVIDAAEQTRSPTIIGFSGDFLTRKGRITKERIEWYGSLGLAAAHSARIPCGLFFNECPFENHIRAAIEAGFNMVMPVDLDASGKGYLQRVQELARFAHRRNVAIEAEIENLPTGASGRIVSGGAGITDPNQAAQFVRETNVDLLSVSVGNVHTVMDGRRDLDIDRVAAINKRVGIPLGLHGGSGISDHSVRHAISNGVTKVAYGTYIKQHYLTAIRAALSVTEINPHRLLGMGGSEDLMVVGRNAVKEAVLERIDLLGCCGRA